MLIKSIFLRTMKKAKLAKKKITGDKAIGIAVIATVGLVGLSLLSIGHAETPYAFTVASSGSLSSPASIISDPNASNGQAVQFGTPFYSGKLLSVQAGSTYLSQFTSLHANSSRPEISYDDSTQSFDDIVAHDGNTTETMLDDYTTNGNL